MGLPKNSRRFKEHMKRYGDDIKLDTFILLPELDLPKGFINVQNIFKSISRNYCGNVQEQISIYEQMVKDMKHAHAMEIAELKL